LDQDVYCDALDAASGPRWTIFFARVPTSPGDEWYDVPHYRSRLQQCAVSAQMIQEREPKREKQQEQQMQHQMQQMQQPLWYDGAGITDAQELLRTLGLSDSLTSLPQLLIVVPIDSEDAYVRALPLNARTADDAYQSLRQTLLSITQVFEDISPENLKNAEGVIAAFDLARHEAGVFQAAKVALRLFTFAKQIFA
jgi:hypothetical protein